MGELLITNGLIVTMDAERTIHRNSSLRIEGNRIVEIGHAKDIKAKTANAEVVDASGQIIIPGFVSCHNHLYSTRGADVVTSIIDGKVVMEDRRVLTLNEEEIPVQGAAAIEDLIERAGPETAALLAAPWPRSGAAWRAGVKKG